MYPIGPQQPPVPTSIGCRKVTVRNSYWEFFLAFDWLKFLYSLFDWLQTFQLKIFIRCCLRQIIQICIPLAPSSLQSQLPLAAERSPFETRTGSFFWLLIG